jgi:tetratricopeptide (TPR) repeat protein
LQAAKSDILHALRIDPIDSEARVLADAIAQAEETKSHSSAPTGQKVTEEPIRVGKPELESEKLKNSGNDALKAGDLQQALKLYTKALDLDSNNTAALGNRAFVNLKLLRFVDAEKDASKVILFTESGEQTIEKRGLLIKALYRRGLARRSMGGKEDLERALSDFNKLLKMDPDNKEASIEKGRTEILIKDKNKTTGGSKVLASNPPPNAKSIAGRGNGSELLFKEVQSVRKPRQVGVAEGQLSSSHLPPSPSDQHVADSYNSQLPPLHPTAHQQKVKSAEKTKKSPVKAAPSLPEELPKTVYELERIWRGLKGHPELFAAYLAAFKLSTFKKVFNDNVSSDLMSSVFACTRDHISEKNPDVAARILEGLTQMPKFDLTASLFPEEDLSSIRTILLKLRDRIGEEKIQNLAQCFKVSTP